MSAGAPTRLVSAPWVLPMVRPPIAEGAVWLDGDDRVVAVGPRSELLAEGLPETRAEGALLPGLVNAHVHLGLAGLAGRVPGGQGFVPWAMRLMRERSTARPGAAAAAAHEAVAVGTAAVGDVTDTLADNVPALAEADLRGVVFHELFGSRDKRTGDALADAERERGQTPWPAGLGYVPAPHAPYSVGPALMRRIFAAVRTASHPTFVHVAEGPEEIELLLHGRGAWVPVLAEMGVPAAERAPGLSPLPYLDSLGAFAGDRPPVLVHMVHASAEDLALAATRRAPVALCPRSNLHIGGRLPNVPAMLSSKVQLCLGTDSLASSPDTSLWGEIATLSGHFPDIAPTTWLEAATLGGAQALALPALGALAPGLRPGLIDVSIEDGLASLVRNPRPNVRWIGRA